jgi:crotonobetaine/carnitine-CoA ligase
MSRNSVLATKVPSYIERRAQIEAEPLPPNLYSLLKETAADVPDADVLHFIENGETLTYAMLQTKVDRMAGTLYAMGVRKSSHVGVMLPNISAFPITWLAIAKLGAVMIPVNTRYTARELHYVLDDGEADYLIIHADFTGLIDAMPAALPRVANDHILVFGAGHGAYRAWPNLDDAALDIAIPDQAPVQNDLLNIQYTSGTTGFPKGCMLTQLYWLTIGKVNAYRDGRPYHRIMSATPFFYMDPQWLLLMAIYRRATLFVAKQQSASRFMRWVRKYAIEFCLMPNVVLKQPETPEDRDNKIIRANCYGFSPAEHVAIEERFDLFAREAFGMTEIGSALFMPIEETDMLGSASCGRPSPFRECRVVDENGNSLPDGQVGELVVRGPGILKGYYRKPEANTAAFFDDWFRTGDLFRRDERGFFYIVGRVKDMIRRAGENIAAREVEAVVCNLPEVAEAAALPVPDDVRGEEVKIYVVPQPGVSRDDVPPQKIIDYCVANLAAFKVPRYIEYRQALPKTPSEKVAKHVLKTEKSDLRVGSWDRIEQRWL